jgi:hypothetical protein
VAEDKKSVLEMISEFCREAAVLIFVFGNLDLWTKGFTGELGKLSIGFWAVVIHFLAITGTALAFGVIGVFTEKWRVD